MLQLPDCSLQAKSRAFSGFDDYLAGPEFHVINNYGDSDVEYL